MPPAEVSSRTATCSNVTRSDVATISCRLMTVVGMGRRPLAVSSTSGVGGAVCARRSDPNTRIAARTKARPLRTLNHYRRGDW